MGGDTVVVTGACGFLGRYVVRCLARKGHRVVGIGHGELLPEEWRELGLIQWHRADVTLQTLEKHAGVPTAILHCAGGGSVAYSMEAPLADFDRTVVTTAHLMEFVRLHAPCCKVVFPSSASVYGAVEQMPIREDCLAAPISQYGAHKLMAEQMIASYARQFGAFASIVRLFSLYGCGLRKQLLWDACWKFMNNDGVFMGTGEEVRDWLHVEDAAELLVAAIGHASAQCPTVNGGSGEGATVKEVLVQLSRSLLLRTELMPKFSGAQRVGDPSRYIAAIEKSKAWGWMPTRVWREGVAEYAAWWRGSSR